MFRQLHRLQSIQLLSAKNSQKSTQIYDYEISIETSKLMSEIRFGRSREKQRFIVIGTNCIAHRKLYLWCERTNNINLCATEFIALFSTHHLKFYSVLWVFDWMFVWMSVWIDWLQLNESEKSRQRFCYLKLSHAF